MLLKENDFGRGWGGVWEVEDAQKSLYSRSILSALDYEVGYSCGFQGFPELSGGVSAIDIHLSSSLSTVTYNMTPVPWRACMRTWGNIMVSEEAPPGTHSWPGKGTYDRIIALLMLTKSQALAAWAGTCLGS